MNARPLALGLLLLPAPALAIELDEIIEAWTLTTAGQDGSDGVDQAEGVVVTGPTRSSRSAGSTAPLTTARTASP